MNKALSQAKSLGILKPLDIQFANILTSRTDHALILAITCVSADARSGHICLPLKLLMPNYLFGGVHPNLARRMWELAGYPSLKIWNALLKKSSIVSDGSRSTPLILSNQRLYLQRMWIYECIVAKFFSTSCFSIHVDEARTRKILNQFFTNNTNLVDWQKVAVTIAITSQVSLIYGGPKTGKAFVITRLLAVLFLLNNNSRMKIIVSSITRKSALYLSKCLNSLSLELNLQENQKHCFPKKAITLYQLLGTELKEQHKYYHRDNPIHIDILIIYEASMINIEMMANLITALSTKTRIIFLGDNTQLPSSEVGASVLSYIFQCSKFGYSDLRRKQLSRITGCMLPSVKNRALYYSISDRLCILRKRYCFKQNNIINRISNSIRIGNKIQTITLLRSKLNKNIRYTYSLSSNNNELIISECITNYQDYLLRIKNREDPISILQAFNKYRLLCVLQDGFFGRINLNNCIEQKLAYAKLINYPSKLESNKDYPGRPIIIRCNAPSLELYNGDIGILLVDNNQKLRAYFLLSNNVVKSILPSRLPEYNTAFAITVQELQGWMFNHIALILPDQILPIVTRELLYTAVNSANHKFSLYAKEKILIHSINTTRQRRGALIEKLIKESIIF